MVAAHPDCPEPRYLPQASPQKSALSPGNGELLPARAFYAALGQVLKAHRTRLSWSQDQLADRIDVAIPTIWRAEKGQLLTLHRICALASAFSVNPAEILREAAAIVKAG